MSYSAKVYKVFIASPSDVEKERKIVRDVLARWNAINTDERKVVLLPVGYESHGAPETGVPAQEYINEEILADCDILIGIFWTRIGSPALNDISGTVSEIKNHVAERKATLLYFSKKPIDPTSIDQKQYKAVIDLKKAFQKKSFYYEFTGDNDLYEKLYDHISIVVKRGKVRPTYDSDIIAQIEDNNELIRRIAEYTPLVSLNLLKIITEEERPDEVWEAIVDKLAKSPAELRDALTYLAKKGAFKHRVYEKGCEKLASVMPEYFDKFMDRLWSINPFEYRDLEKKQLTPNSAAKQRYQAQIKKQEKMREVNEI